MYLIVNQKLSGLIMFNKKNMMLVTLLSFVISCGNNKELQIDEIINAAVKNPLRKIENTEKDELNKPVEILKFAELSSDCLLYTSPSPRDKRQSRMPSSA